MSSYIGTYQTNPRNWNVAWNSGTLDVTNIVTASKNTWQDLGMPEDAAIMDYSWVRKYADASGGAALAEKSSTLMDDWMLLKTLKTQGQSQPLWLLAAVEKVRKLALLPEGWDRHGSRPIQSASIANMIWILSVVASSDAPAPHISPISGGALQIEWSRGDRDLELVTCSDGSIHYLKAGINDVDDVQEGLLSSGDSEQVTGLLRWLIGR